ncbi:hypothetical protein L227DRAFT_337756 [Lentinus tigrinus ALCF2SS1-6]|uniref:Uncharacterized protein n=1 Tax=Lentinus tigrinus ALCF2SS1-6 TaxID=1328759 RepID=A0A5C2RSY0_9APHY|nr:hypothetical protein L227DRAFT_337756 [Lentinus tigrinus ALCF2SS1-6]
MRSNAEPRYLDSTIPKPAQRFCGEFLWNQKLRWATAKCLLLVTSWARIQNQPVRTSDPSSDPEPVTAHTVRTVLGVVIILHAAGPSPPVSSRVPNPCAAQADDIWPSAQTRKGPFPRRLLWLPPLRIVRFARLLEPCLPRALRLFTLDVPLSPTPPPSALEVLEACAPDYPISRLQPCL